ncbi:hypothetical protein [Microcystis aeruginosa]|jgi:tetratricopeptide (TPR) repeat protein|uniref:Uncharacterized protein n=1 Tax=Microcystis aeruginosa PCC 9808 TaxID=1160284 RepID=I4HSA2_MICAE|nr:hypothetical protein [Microcystis aeruginosa]GCA89549.1 hypothetical protein MiTa_02900 [Microcystis aeruginosa NIES-4264]CCI24926.1 exported hypothetical protein [Microcystis aeruginosa PCC 9808]
MVKSLNFAALAVLGFSLYAGYVGSVSVMTAGLTASIVLLFFANLDKIQEFKASATGIEARTRDFVATLPADAKSSLERGTLGDPKEYAPFKWSERTSAPDYKVLRNDILKSNMSDFLASIGEAELLTLHAWYNENNNHSLALQTLSLAIAKGTVRDPATTSKNYSFASASLRKSYRLDEAEAFALLALKLNPNNLDAKYNLALINKLLGNTKEGEKFAMEVIACDGQYYRGRLQEEFPNLLH